jgi:hypothetical protein
MWMHDIVVSRCRSVDGEFHRLFQRPHETIAARTNCIRHTQSQAVLGCRSPMWLRQSSGIAIMTERVVAPVGHRTKVATFSDPQRPARDPVGTKPSSVNALFSMIPIQNTFFWSEMTRNDLNRLYEFAWISTWELWSSKVMDWWELCSYISHLACDGMCRCHVQYSEKWIALIIVSYLSNFVHHTNGSGIIPTS